MGFGSRFAADLECDWEGREVWFWVVRMGTAGMAEESFDHAGLKRESPDIAANFFGK